MLSLLVTKGIAIRSKKLLVAPGITTCSKDATSSVLASSGDQRCNPARRWEVFLADLKSVPDIQLGRRKEPELGQLASWRHGVEFECSRKMVHQLSC